ncbi:MAG: YihY/virulence factor BrkB family protein [Actinomycetota bacterium]|nr:YihY/virulence factor BrkB family protein [Actinomycetota bacterium]
MTNGRSLARRVEERLGGAIGKVYETLERNRFTRFPWAVVQTFSAGQGALLAGSMAYFTFLSLLPLLMIGSFILGTILQGNEAVQDALSGAVQQVFPGIGARKILNQLIESRVVFGVLGLITVAYAGSGFVGALTACLNRMWEVTTGRNPVGQKILNFLVVLLLSLVLIGSVGLTLWVAYLTQITLGDTAGLAQRIEFFASPISLFVVLLVLYRILPARKMSWRSQIPGALAGAISIEVLKRGFQFWAQNSAGVSALPRTLLSVVLLLVWLGFFGQIILYGAALNVVIDRSRRGASIFPTLETDVLPAAQSLDRLGSRDEDRAGAPTPAGSPRESMTRRS